MRVKIPLVYILLCLVLAGLIHIVAVLTLPGLAPKNAWARLVPLGEPNMLVQLPRAIPGREIMPRMAPDVRYAFCHFDLTAGPVKLRVVVPDDLLLIAFYTPRGDNFYTVAGADVRRSQSDVIIAHDDQPVAETSADAPQELDEVVVVRSPVDEGIAMIRAPLSGPSRATRAEQALKASHCGPYAG